MATIIGFVRQAIKSLVAFSVGLFVVAPSILCGTGADAGVARDAGSRYVTIETFGSEPANAYGLLTLAVSHPAFPPPDRDRLLAIYAGAPPVTSTRNEFEVHREAARRLEIVKNRVAELAGHVSLPGVVLEYPCDLGRYDFSRKAFPLSALPDQTFLGWCFGIAVPKPKEISSPESREMKAAFFLVPMLAQQACNGANAQWYDVVPCRKRESSFPLSVPVDETTAERLVAASQAKRSAPRVVVRLYGHFDQDRFIFQREGADFWHYKIRFEVEKVEFLNAAAPTEVLYSGL